MDLSVEDGLAGSRPRRRGHVPLFLTVRMRRLFWLFVVAFNLFGIFDLIFDYYHAVQVGLPSQAEQPGSTYAIPIICVPLLMITYLAAFYLLLRRRPKVTTTLADGAATAT